jgi:hypothetical protein
MADDWKVGDVERRVSTTKGAGPGFTLQQGGRTLTFRFKDESGARSAREQLQQIVASAAEIVVR